MNTLNTSVDYESYVFKTVQDRVGLCLAAGMSVIPVARPGSGWEAKKPLGPWKVYQTQRVGLTEAPWVFRPDKQGRAPGLAVVCGKISGGLEMIEVEARGVEFLPRIWQAAQEQGGGNLVEKLRSGWVEKSMSGGYHYFLRSTTGEAARNMKLAITSDNQVLAETRGEGGYTVIAPTRGCGKEHAKAWVTTQGGPETCPVFTPKEINFLHQCFQTINQKTTPTPTISRPVTRPATRQATRPGVRPGFGVGLRPGDRFNHDAKWEDILEPHNWRCVKQDPDGQKYWCRPGKNHGISATTGYGQNDYLYVFSTSTPFENEKPYSKFAAYTLLNFAGDYTAAAKHLQTHNPTTHPHPNTHPAASPPPTPIPNPGTLSILETIPHTNEGIQL